MTRYDAGPPSDRRTDQTVPSPPPTTGGMAVFAMLPFAVVLAASFPIVTTAALAGAALAALSRRLRMLRRRTAADSDRLPRKHTHDV
jgi:hypothetical protein